jgi:hypothetical protein
MGIYTPNLNLYKPAASEFVDVETQLNRNWDIADDAVKKLFEYKYSNDTIPDTSNSVIRQRFYKTYSNSLVNYFQLSSTWIQDSVAFVSSWVNASSLFQNGTEESNPNDPVFYRIIKKSGGTTTEIEWTGSFWAGGGNMDLNSNILNVMTLPASVTPTVSKYFDCYAGNCSSDYSFARVVFLSAGTVEYKRYGSNTQTADTEKRIDLTGIKYNLEVAA